MQYSGVLKVTNVLLSIIFLKIAFWGTFPLKSLPNGGKLIGGTNRITEKIMNQVQCYSGKTIRENSDSVYLMNKGIWAILGHCSEDTDTPGTRHHFYPRGDDTCVDNGRQQIVVH